MRIELIAACDQKGVIGTARGGLPWDLPLDRAHFRRQSGGTCMLLGRRTYQEMRGWFTNQMPIILTREPGFRADGPGLAVASIGQALAAARSRACPRLLVAGGAEVFAATLPLADRLIITHVQVDWQQEHPGKGDGEDPPRFPDIDPSRWRVIRRDPHPADADHPWPLEIRWYQRQP